MSNASPAASSSVVPSRSEQPLLAHREQQRVPAAREQAGEGRLDGVGLEIERRDVTVEVIHGTSGTPRAHARALAAEMPTSSAPTSPGPCVTAIRSISSSGVSAASSASRTTGETSSRCLRDATSGTTPPKRACRSACDETTDDSTRPSSARRPRRSRRTTSRSRGSRGLLGRRRLAPHDHGVLAIVRVVPAAETAGLEAEALVEPDRARVRDAHLERVATSRVGRGRPRRVARAASTRSRADGTRPRRRRS